MSNNSKSLGKTKQAASEITGTQIEGLANLDAKQAAAALEALYRNPYVDKAEHHPKRREVGDIIDSDVCLAFNRSGAEADAGRKMTDEEWFDFAVTWRKWSMNQGHQEEWQWYYFFLLHNKEYPNALNPDVEMGRKPARCTKK